MSVLFDPDSQCFTIHTENSTYQFQVDRFGYLLHLYYGRRSEGCMDWLPTYADRGFSGNPGPAGNERTYSLDALPQEFPFLGSGDSRSTLLVIRDAQGAYGCDLRYTGHEVQPGKYALPGLPAVCSTEAEDGAETLKVFLSDPRLGLRVTLLYGVLPKLDIITRSVLVENTGASQFRVEKLQSACLDFLHGEFDLISFSGRHAMERSVDRSALTHGSFQVGSRRGYSSHQYNPFVILCDRETTETAGRCCARQVVCSGGFSAEAELDQYRQSRLQMGLSAEQFSYPLCSGQQLCGPEVILSFSGAGLERLSHQLHRCIRRHVCRGEYRDRVRPVLLNSWEASYFDFSRDSLLALADEAKALGMEMLVLDDGWFGNRFDDNRALGDWTANEEKLGGSLGDLIRAVNARGLKFGIWMEPEMISEESSLYREHPDWAMVIPGKEPPRSRNQLVLDLSREEVCDWLYATICGVLDQGNIEYLKWDVNRSISDVYSFTAPDQGCVLYDYMLGLYGLLEKLCQRYPGLLIEGCSGGGGRFDAGMLYYCPQIWCSDNTDAVDRLQIQYGTSFGYPVSAVGSHVSACPNHQTGRTVSLKTRADVAMSGTFGYELDPAKLTESERAEVREQIAAFHADAELIQNGLYYRLSDPRTAPCAAWEIVSEDGRTARITVVLLEKQGNSPPVYVVPRGLTAGARYCLRENGRVYPADALCEAGLPLPLGMNERNSLVLHLDRLPAET